MKLTIRGCDILAKAPAAVKVNDIFDEDEGETVEEKEANRARRERMETARRLKEEKDARDGKKASKGTTWPIDDINQP